MGALDFEWYKKKCGIEKIDYIYVQLGGNEVADSPVLVNLSNHDEMAALCKRVVENAKEFIKVVREGFPGVKIKIMGITTPSMTGGMGASYGAKLPYCDRYGYTRYVLALNEAYEALCNEDGCREFLEFINVSAQFDSEYGFPVQEKPVNTRCKETEPVGTNGLHPSHDGYLMVADAAFRNMANLD